MLVRFGLPFACLLLLSPDVHAHVRLDAPPPRHPETGLKQGPCGKGANDPRTTRPELITTFTAGETITVRFTETIDHDPAHYRIALSYGGDQDFVDPTDFEDIGPEELPILLDGIPDAEGGNNQAYNITVTLPDISCEICTLQVMQVMKESFRTSLEGALYYTCADIVIEPKENGTGGTTGAESGGAPSSDGGNPNMESGGAPGNGGDGEPSTSGGTAGIGGSPLPSSTGGQETTGSGGTSTEGSGGTPPEAKSGGCSMARAPTSRISLLLPLLGLAAICRRLQISK